MRLSHTRPVVRAQFDEPNVVSSAGLVPVMRLAERAGLDALAGQWLSVPTDKGANAGGKVTAVVAGMVAGADSIEDMGVLRHGGMGRLFDRPYAPSTLGSFLRAFTFGHVRQLGVRPGCDLGLRLGLPDVVAMQTRQSRRRCRKRPPLAEDGGRGAHASDVRDQAGSGAAALGVACEGPEGPLRWNSREALHEIARTGPSGPSRRGACYSVARGCR